MTPLLRRLGQHNRNVAVATSRDQLQIELVQGHPAGSCREPTVLSDRLRQPTRGRDQEVVAKKLGSRRQVSTSKRFQELAFDSFEVVQCLRPLLSAGR
jgi:hypothetical protein